jgi:hypothetical protein
MAGPVMRNSPYFLTQDEFIRVVQSLDFNDLAVTICDLTTEAQSPLESEIRRLCCEWAKKSSH